MRERLEKRKKKRRRLKAILMIILILVLAIAGFIGYRTHKNGGGMRGFLATMLGHDEHTVENLDELFVLIIGESDGMTDTIMLCSYDPKTQEASMLSIPRDTFIGESKYYATASDKINSVYTVRGIEGLVKEVEELTNIEIPYYVKVDTESLRKLVDTIGGVDYDVPIDMNYDDNKQNLHIHLEAGYQHLDGDKAEQLVRFRHNNNGTSYPAEYGDNDYGRMKTQREFLKVVLGQTIKLGNVLKITEFIDIGSKYVTTNMNINEIKDYVPYIIDFNLNDLKTATLPGESEKCNGVWVIVPDEEGIETIVDEMFLSTKGKKSDESEETKNNILEDKETTNGNNTISTDIKVSEIEKNDVEEKDITVEIINGASSKNKLTRLERVLTNAGYTVESTGTTNETERTIIINKSKMSEEETEELKETIGTGYISNMYDETSDVDYCIIIGNDY